MAKKIAGIAEEHNFQKQLVSEIAVRHFLSVVERWDREQLNRWLLDAAGTIGCINKDSKGRRALEF